MAQLDDNKMKGIIYYTDNRLIEPMFSVVQRQILKANLPVTSVSLEPIDFGNNTAIKGKRSYPTMVRQIITALERTSVDDVFFCEHDVLYHPSHFDFTPPKDNIFYYNANVWRWDYPKDRVITYGRLISLSAMCCNRNLALEHYRKRLEYIKKHGQDKYQRGEPQFFRTMGYEPGTKKKERGGITDDDFETWFSAFPNIDIRHRGTFSPPKVTLDKFTWAPENWLEMNASKVPGWDLRKLFYEETMSWVQEVV